MASQGPNNPGSSTNDTTVGAISWSNTGFNYIQSQDGFASSALEWSGTGDALQYSIKLYYNSAVQGDNKSTGASAAGGSYKTWGGASDLWGLALTRSDVNLSDFGAVLAYIDGGGTQISYYLRGQGFGFSIPTGATIDGVKVEAYTSTYGNFSWIGVAVDHMRITVYYTEAAAGSLHSRPLRQSRNVALVRR